MTSAALYRPVRAGVPTKGTRSYLYQRSPTHRHQGVDLVAPEGTPVVAVAPGVVTHASASLAPGFSGYGRHVAIAGDDGYHTLFAHLATVLVRPGQRVTRGEVIGTVGATCFDRSDPSRACKGPHLHFEASEHPYPMASEAARVDPVAYMSQGSAETPPQPARPFAGLGPAVATIALGWLARRFLGGT